MSSIDLTGLVGGAGPPPDSGSDTAGPTPGAVTSDHTGGALDFIRTAIMSLQHFAEITDDDQELAKVHKCIVGLQSILADHASTKDKALGIDARSAARSPFETALLIVPSARYVPGRTVHAVK
jgi:hypothetical protein